MTEIVCITGKARAAKESVARMLKDELERNSKRVLIAHYADPIKHICRNWFGWNGRMDAEGRSFLRYVGTDIVRAKRPDFWVDYTLGLLSMMGDEWDYVIIPDAQHPNELDLERYGFQHRHIRIEDDRQDISPGMSEPDFTLMNAGEGRLRGNVADVARNLAYAA